MASIPPYETVTTSRGAEWAVCIPAYEIGNDIIAPIPTDCGTVIFLMFEDMDVYRPNYRWAVPYIGNPYIKKDVIRAWRGGIH